MRRVRVKSYTGLLGVGTRLANRGGGTPLNDGLATSKRLDWCRWEVGCEQSRAVEHRSSGASSRSQLETCAQPDTFVPSLFVCSSYLFVFYFYVLASSK
eukprot:1028095-Pleurochrysis_carterae.AAC.2